MAYKKRYRRKKTYKPRAKGANDRTVTVWSGHSVLEKANKALQLASKVYRFVNTEIKFHDVTTSATAIPNTGTINGLSAVPQGDGQSSRDGDSMKPLHLTVRGYLVSNQANAYPQIVRVIVFRGKQENGVGFSATDILETASVLSPKNYTDRFRTKILYDQTFHLNQPGLTAAAYGEISRPFNINMKIIGHTNFTATSTSIEDGGLYILYLSNNVTNLPTMDYYSRLTYVDN